MPGWHWQNRINDAANHLIMPTCAIVIEVALLSMAPIDKLRGENLIPYLTWFMIGGSAFLIAVLQINRKSHFLPSIWLFAILFRATVLFSGPPSLSDDVFRYIWDGHLINRDVNPYLYPVNAQELDSLGTPLRSLVNHNWMASPYLPASQMLFGLTEMLFPQSVFAYQAMMCSLDLMTGLLVWKLLRKFQFPVQLSLIYLWNPLVIMEFTHSAHIDALMVFLSVASFALILLPTSPRGRLLGQILAVPIYAGAILTKGIPLFFLPIISILIGWKRTIILAIVTFSASLPFALVPGWGLFGPLDGTGLLGAIRIYNAYWNYNSSIFHWLETILAGYSSPGAIPFESGVGLTARTVVGLLLALVMLVSVILMWKKRHNLTIGSILFRGVIIPFTAYLLLTPTLHPWYITLLLPFIPFAFSPATSLPRKIYTFSFLVLSITVNFSYLTYVNEFDFREYRLVRLLEYVPFYSLMITALLIYIIKVSGIKTRFRYSIGNPYKTG